MRTLILALPLVLAAATAARADFDSCVAGLRSAAAAKGVSGATFDRAMAGVTPDMKVIEAMNNQPEFKTPIWDYLGTLVDDEKVAEGRSMMRQHASTLAAAEQRFGVDPPHHRGGLGRRERFRQGAGQDAAGPGAFDRCLPGAAPQCLLQGRIDRYPADHPARRCPPRAAVRLLGRRLRSHPVHPLDLPAARRRRRWRRKARPRRFHPRRIAFDRELYGQGRLGHRRDLGLRGPRAWWLFRPDRAQPEAAGLVLGGARHRQIRRLGAVRLGQCRSPDAGWPQRPGLPRLQEL
jgi:hypothetical protein